MVGPLTVALQESAAPPLWGSSRPAGFQANACIHTEPHATPISHTAALFKIAANWIVHWAVLTYSFVSAVNSPSSVGMVPVIPLSAMSLHARSPSSALPQTAAILASGPGRASEIDRWRRTGCVQIPAAERVHHAGRVLAVVLYEPTAHEHRVLALLYHQHHREEYAPHQRCGLA